jgi:Rieske Fe-S protein
MSELSHSPQETRTPEPQEGDTGGLCLGRREFLAALVGTFGVLWGLLTLVPVYFYLRPPKTADDESSKVSSVNLGDPKALPVNTGKNFAFGSQPAIVIHTESGYHAYSAVCTHLGCTVQYRQDMGKIYCGCHGGQYDPETGKNIAGPPPKPLKELKIAEVNGQLVVSKA